MKPHYIPKRIMASGRHVGWHLYTRGTFGLTFAGYLWSKK
jgi:hypothetical protein